MKNRTLEIYNGGRKMISRGRKGMYILSVLLLLIFYGISFAQDAEVQKSNWLLGVIFKLESMRDKAIADIQKYEGDIQKCDTTINKSENIVRLAQQKGNVQAEVIAREALAKANEAKVKNEKNRSMAELKKKRSELAIANVRNMLADKLSQNQEIKSVVTNYSGNVSILKKNGETIPLENNRSGCLETGDEIWTLGNSSAEIQFLEGRGSLKVGEYSKVKMEADDAGTEVMNMIQGKVNISVEKVENYQKMMEERIKAYKEDLKTVKDETKQKIVDEYESMSISLKKALVRFAKKFEVRTESAVVADRGTQFLVYEDDMKGTEVVVLEGGVELKSRNETRTVVVNEGYRAAVAKGGILSDPEKIDLSKIERWWEK